MARFKDHGEKSPSRLVRVSRIMYLLFLAYGFLTIGRGVTLGPAAAAPRSNAAGWNDVVALRLPPNKREYLIVLNRQGDVVRTVPDSLAGTSTVKRIADNAFRDSSGSDYTAPVISVKPTSVAEANPSPAHQPAGGMPLPGDQVLS